MVALTLSACRACHDDNPYVPFSLSGSASASASAPVAAPDPIESVASFKAVHGTPPPGDPKTFPLGTASVSVRAGRVFRKGLAFEADGDANDDLFAWTEAVDGSKGEMVFFHGGAKDAAEVVLAKIPKEADIGDCSHETVLKRIGNGVVVVILSLECGDAKEKHQWISVARLDPSHDPAAPKAPEARLIVRTREPIQMDVIAEDRDDDKIEDLVFFAFVAGDTDKDRISASLVLWDRPAGYAWDPSEPEASLGKLGQALLARAVAKKPDATARAEKALGFVRALCSDLGGAKVTTSAGAPKCVESRVIGDAMHTIAFAANSAGDLPRSMAAADAVANLKFDHGRLPQIEGLWTKKMKKVEATISRRPVAKPSKKPGSFSPLMFDEGGGLLISGDDEVFRVDLATGEETKSDAAPWSRSLSWAAGDATVQIGAATRSCPASTVSVSASARAAADVELPVLSALIPASVLKDKCEKGAVGLAPLLIDNNGAVVALGGEIFRASFGDKGVTFERATLPAATEAASPSGSARSADGKAVVLALSKSLFVSRNGAAERWRGADIVNLKQCVVASQTPHVACVSGDAAVIVTAKSGK